MECCTYDYIVAVRWQQENSIKRSLELDDLLQNLALTLANNSLVLVRLQNVHNTYEHVQWSKEIFGAPESGPVETGPTRQEVTALFG